MAENLLINARHHSFLYSRCYHNVRPGNVLFYRGPAVLVKGGSVSAGLQIQLDSLRDSNGGSIQLKLQGLIEMPLQLQLPLHRFHIKGNYLIDAFDATIAHPSWSNGEEVSKEIVGQEKLSDLRNSRIDSGKSLDYYASILRAFGKQDIDFSFFLDDKNGASKLIVCPVIEKQRSVVIVVNYDFSKIMTVYFYDGEKGI